MVLNGWRVDAKAPVVGVVGRDPENGNQSFAKWYSPTAAPARVDRATPRPRSVLIHLVLENRRVRSKAAVSALDR
jgi:hypothetical protein